MSFAAVGADGLVALAVVGVHPQLRTVSVLVCRRTAVGSKEQILTLGIPAKGRSYWHSMGGCAVRRVVERVGWMVGLRYGRDGVWISGGK